MLADIRDVTFSDHISDQLITILLFDSKYFLLLFYNFLANRLVDPLLNQNRFSSRPGLNF